MPAGHALAQKPVLAPGDFAGESFISFAPADPYRQQVDALYQGGVDLFLIETITDTLNCKAAIKAILDWRDEGHEELPIWISGTITDAQSRLNLRTTLDGGGKPMPQQVAALQRLALMVVSVVQGPQRQAPRLVLRSRA